MNIDDLSIGQAKQLASIFGANADNSHWRIGEAYIIRTVTMILTGRLEKVTPNELVISSAAWIAETGRFSETIKNGTLKEVEPYGDNEVIIGRGSLIDATIWTHKLPRDVK